MNAKEANQRTYPRIGNLHFALREAERHDPQLYKAYGPCHLRNQQEMGKPSGSAGPVLCGLQLLQAPQVAEKENARDGTRIGRSCLNYPRTTKRNQQHLMADHQAIVV